jgi:hypothetical protein
MAGRYMGFDALKGKIEAEGKTPASAAAIAASVGRRKYGAKRFNSAAAAGKKLGSRRPANVPRPGQEGGPLHYE